MKILIPNTIDLPVTVDVEHAVYDIDAAIPEEHRDAEVLVVWHNSSAWLQEAARVLPKLRLVQALASGADVVLNAGFGDDVRICSGRSLHDGPVAEHALALILSAVRRLDRLRDAQREHRWDDDFNDVQSASDTQRSYTLAGARVTIWGFGLDRRGARPLPHGAGRRGAGHRPHGRHPLGLHRARGCRCDGDPRRDRRARLDPSRHHRDHRSVRRRSLRCAGAGRGVRERRSRSDRRRERPDRRPRVRTAARCRRRPSRSPSLFRHPIRSGMHRICSSRRTSPATGRSVPPP